MAYKIPGPAYRIVTKRTIVRCWHPEDAPLLKAAIDENLDHLRPWMVWANQEPTDLETKIDLIRVFRGNFDLGKDFTYGVFNQEESQVIGGTGLHPRPEGSAREIGYWIHKDYINQGLATEISAALTKVAFEVEHVEWVEIHCGPANIRSAAVPRKLGYQHEATLRRRFVTGDGQPRDTMIWTLFADEYPRSPASQGQIEAYDAAGRRIM
jgi:RimJ/RimL family protein N-acetyltransferase